MKKLLTLVFLLIMGVGMGFANNYLVVGDGVVCNGENWNKDAVANVMETADEGATYTLTVTGAALEAGNYEYKIVEKGSWTEYYPNSGGGNASFTITKPGIYTIVYTYTVEGSTCEVTPTKTGAYTYSIAGNNAALFGTTWDAANTDNEMSEDDGTFTWEKSDVELTAGTVEFKVVGNHSWSISHPTDNYELTIPSDGTYKVTIEFDSDSKEITKATATKKSTYSVTFVNGKKWDEVAAYVWNVTPFTEIEGGWPGKQLSKTGGTVTFNGEELDVYAYTLETYDSAPDKIIFNNNKAGESPEKEQTADLNFVDGKQYTDAVTFIPVYAVLGSNEAKDDKLFFASIWGAGDKDYLTESAGTWTKTFSNVNIKAQKVIYKVAKYPYLEATEVETWYPAGDDAEINISEDGTYHITFTFNGTSASHTYIPATETFNVTEAGWATAKTTYAVDFTSVVGLEAYTATVDETTVTLHKQGVVPANTPLVLKGITKVVPTVANNEADAVTNSLKWYDNYDVNDTYAHVYGLAKGDDDKARFTRVKSGTTITNKAILEFINPTSSREFYNVVFEDETTGISQIENAQPANVQNGAIYNLNGQRVMNPGKGLYIVNGKKVIMK